MLRSLTGHPSLWFLPGILCLSGWGWSKTPAARPDLPSLDDRDQLEFALLDHPKQLVPQLRQWLDDHRVTEPSIAWMRVIWLLAQQDEMDKPETILEAARFAWDQKQFIEWVDLKLAQVRLQLNTRPFAEVALQYGAIVENARKVGNPVITASALARQATFLLDHNQVQEAMGLSLEATNLLNAQSQVSLRQINIVRDAFALTLVSQDQWDAALETYKLIDQDYRDHGVRGARAEVLYNIGFYYLEGQELSPEALTYLNQSLQLAIDIRDLDTQAASYYGLSIYYHRVGQHKKSIDLGLQALRIYQDMGNKAWITYTAVRLAEVYLDNKEYQKSLDAITIAARHVSDSNLESQMKMERLRNMAYKALGNLDKAYEHLELYAEKMRLFQEGKVKEEYSKAAAQVGLQFAEEKSRSLEKEKSLQAQTLKIEQDRNAALKKQNELQQEQIRLLNNFRILSLIAIALTLAVLIALFHVRSQAAIIRGSRQIMKEVLDNVDEAILIIDHELKLTFGYSSYVNKVFDIGSEDVSMKPFLDLLFPDESNQNEMAIMIREVLLASVGESDLSWEANHTHLPSEIERRKRTFLVNWQPLFDERQTIIRFLISMRDITEYRQLQKDMAAEKQRIGTIQMKLEEVLTRDFGTIDRFMKKMSEDMPGLEALLQAGDHRGAFRVLHTSKGAARTLGLKQLATAIHRMESCLPSASRPDPDLAGLALHWQGLRTELSAYQELLEPILQRTNSGTALATDLYAHASLYAHEMKSRLEAERLTCGGLTILDEILNWEPRILQVVHEIILLGISNSLDHGFLRPHRQGKAVASAHIKICAQASDAVIHLSLSDNGAGIDWEALRRKAQELSIPLAEGAPLTSLLFQDGLSSATDMSESSGRGVGLTAIRSLCESLGGTVTLQSMASGGTGLFLKFPQHSSSGPVAA